MIEYYITTPVYYVNDIPHVGTAYTSIVSDAIARYHALQNQEVFFLSGTDEHGQKVFNSAKKNNLDTQVFVDKNSATFRGLLSELSIDISYFIRTTACMHKTCVQDFWNIMMKKDYIYKGKYKGWYSERDEAFFSEADLINGYAPTGAPVELLEEDCYFFRLSAFQEQILEFYEQNPQFIAPEERYAEVKAFVKKKLKDLCISRNITNWGILVPNDETQSIYVWFDALFNYISALQINDLHETWPVNLHVIGKDILIFHAVYWVAFLMACDMQPPKQILAHGWWQRDGQKMSKSIGNIVNPFEKIKEFGVDRLRYYLLRETSFSTDGNYSDQGLINRTNADLSNNIGNLIQRVLSLIYKYCDGFVPKVKSLHNDDKLFLEQQSNIWLKNLETSMNNYRIFEALERICGFATECNVYIDNLAPWKLAKTDLERTFGVLYVLLNGIRNIGILLQPFIPSTARRILLTLNESLHSEELLAFNVLAKPITMGAQLNWNQQPLFERLDEYVSAS